MALAAVLTIGMSITPLNSSSTGPRRYIITGPT
jgi:hypothetical protein